MLLGIELCCVPSTLCRNKTREAARDGGGARTRIGAGAYDENNIGVGFPIVNKN